MDGDQPSGSKSARNMEEHKFGDLLASSDGNDLRHDEKNPFDVEKRASKATRPHALSGDLDINETMSAGLLSGNDSDGIEIPGQKRNVTMIEKFVNDIGYRHQMINLSCQVPILSQLDDLQKEIDECEKLYTNSLLA